jgi:hypothetical protein
MKFRPHPDVLALSQYLDLLSALVDESPCEFDHHGGCQAHGYISLQPGEECPQAELKRLLASRDITPNPREAR